MQPAVVGHLPKMFGKSCGILRSRKRSWEDGLFDADDVNQLELDVEEVKRVKLGGQTWWREGRNFRGGIKTRDMKGTLKLAQEKGKRRLLTCRPFDVYVFVVHRMLQHMRR